MLLMIGGISAAGLGVNKICDGGMFIGCQTINGYARGVTSQVGSRASCEPGVLAQLNDCCSSDEGYSGRARKN